MFGWGSEQAYTMVAAIGVVGWYSGAIRYLTPAPALTPCEKKGQKKWSSIMLNEREFVHSFSIAVYSLKT